MMSHGPKTSSTIPVSRLVPRKRKIPFQAFHDSMKFFVGFNTVTTSSKPEDIEKKRFNLSESIKLSTWKRVFTCLMKNVLLQYPLYL